MLHVTGISQSYGTTILSNISLVLGDGVKVALIGPNGSGKSTLLSIIAGVTKPDGGKVELSPGCCIGYLPQEIDTSNEHRTIKDYLRHSTGIAELESKMEKCSQRMDDSESAHLFDCAQEQYLRLEGYDFDRKVNIMMHGFGLDTIKDSRPVSQLSGGQKTKVALIGVLLKGADILLLDEPTNNLDLPAIMWLESYIKASQASCLLVSHDQVFVDRIVSKVFEIDWYSRELSEFKGNYTQYRAHKEIIRNQEEKRLEEQEEEISRLEHSAKEKKSWAISGGKQVTGDNDKYLRGYQRDRSARIGTTAKSLEKARSRIKRVEPSKIREPLVIALEPTDNPAKQALSLTNAYVGYNDSFSIGPITLSVYYGKRLGILGLNGSGKSTLLKALMGELPAKSGHVHVGESLIIGNLMQEHANLPRDETVISIFKKSSPADDERIFHLLHKFHFTKEDAFRVTGTMSPGERARLIMALFVARSVNVLILDEPTNHLDIDALHALVTVLKDFSGTIVFVSHDRLFIDAIQPDFLYELRNGQLAIIPSWDTYVTDIVQLNERLIKTMIRG